MARRSAAGEPLLTTAELCRDLQVSDREVRRWRHEDPPVPSIPVTERCVRYFLADVLAWRAGRGGQIGQAS
ncbi:MAG: DNA-binding protein [Patulibacter sp.]|nr:DNA-binding protein [Patulibacter sp.]